ncbi:hypothetical protein DO97_01385 [Neosynechococcus sphagnicola sy1]|uniref:Uncharacterized protein n=1 Tax=Neosynechococcus sphagnicola sy1 TaxID=1497020 RepID=A0A098TMU6_9CYAN|nr:hypothetical protein DO97_01385 [Neosynechococcus sphagnicola sy1]
MDFAKVFAAKSPKNRPQTLAMQWFTSLITPAPQTQFQGLMFGYTQKPAKSPTNAKADRQSLAKVPTVGLRPNQPIELINWRFP